MDIGTLTVWRVISEAEDVERTYRGTSLVHVRDKSVLKITTSILRQMSIYISQTFRSFSLSFSIKHGLT